MIALREKLLLSSVCKICACSHNVALLQVSGTWISYAKLSYAPFYRKNALLVPVHWWKGHQMLSFKNIVSYKVSWSSGESRSRMKSALYFQQRKKNVLAQPLDPKVKVAANKLPEGPVLHHSAAAALVATKQRLEQHSNDKEESHCGRVTASEENPEMSEQHTEELLSSTTAHVRRVSASDEWDFHLQASKGQSPDIEYVVEQRSMFPAKPTVKLSGVLPASAHNWRAMEWNLADLPSIYAALAKSRLTGLVVVTALGGYVLAPVPFSPATLVGAVAGTGLVSAAANAINQVLEVPYDAQMSRTANRALVRGVVSPLHAACFATTCGVGGLTLLLGLCGPAAAGLGLLNLTLYTAVYTPLKRRTIANTWVGSLVGAIPPLIGWCGCGGPLIGADSWGAWLMAGLLFSWQFPHFNALSWNLRADYSKAGYKMMCVTNPRLSRATCVRYSTALLLLSFAAPALSVTTWTFAANSAPLNAFMLYLSYRFYKDGDSRSARNLFRFSLLHLPAVMVLLIISKKWRSTAPDDAVPPLYTASVVYNNAYQAQTVPTIVVAAAESGVHCDEKHSKIADVTIPTSASEVRKLEGNSSQISGSVLLATELEQETVSSTPLQMRLNSHEDTKTVVHLSGTKEKNEIVTNVTRDSNVKTLEHLVGEVSR